MRLPRFTFSAPALAGALVAIVAGLLVLYPVAFLLQAALNTGDPEARPPTQYGLENFARLSPGSWCEAGKILVESERKSAILSRMSLESLRPRVRARVATHVFLRLTAMDVCCGPPASR